VDYVLWGSYVGGSRGGVRQLRSVVFSRRTSRELPPLVVNDQPASEVVGLLFEQMTRASFLRQGAPELSTALAAATRSERLLGELVTPVSTSAETRDDVLEAYEALEQAMAHEAGEAAAAPLLERSQAALLRALVKDPRDPLALMLLSSCHFNLSRLQTAAGDKAAAQRSAAAMLGRSARRTRNAAAAASKASSARSWPTTPCLSAATTRKPSACTARWPPTPSRLRSPRPCGPTGCWLASTAATGEFPATTKWWTPIWPENT
jgi:hypothetical protein